MVVLTHYSLRGFKQTANAARAAKSNAERALSNG